MRIDWIDDPDLGDWREIGLTGYKIKIQHRKDEMEWRVLCKTPLGAQVQLRNYYHSRDAAGPAYWHAFGVIAALFEGGRPL
jgi:hypothetical protein